MWGGDLRAVSRPEVDRPAESRNPVGGRKPPPRPHLPRKVTWATAVFLVVSLLGVAIARWPQLLRYYRLTQLRVDPSLLEEYLLSREESRKGAAVDFVKEENGKRVLFHLYLKEYERTRHKFSVFGLLVHQRKVDRKLAAGILALWQRGYIHQGRSVSRPVTRTGSIAMEAADPRRRRIILSLLDACVGETHRASELPGFELQIQPILNGKPRPPIWPAGVKGAQITKHEKVIWHENHPGMNHVCFYRIIR